MTSNLDADPKRHSGSGPACHPRRLALLVCGLLLAYPIAASAQSESFLPKGKTVELIVPYPPGGPTDAGARLMADVINKDLGINIQILNKPGANQQIGIQELVRSKPDGGTIAFVSTYPATTTYLNPAQRAPYTRRDFQLVAQAVFDPQYFFTPAGTRFKSLRELVDAAVAAPRKIRFATSGTMSSGAIMGMMIEQDTGARFTFVPFPGAAPAAASLTLGDIDISPFSAVAGRPFVEDGKLRALAAADEREPLEFPGTPSAASQGFKIESLTNYGFILPAKTPDAIVDGWSHAIGKALQDPDLLARLKRIGLLPKYRDRKDYEAYWATVEKRTASIISFMQER
jgi:tripartite-type tricarboxylate transporter receptor subunit TctC